jgi:hypothetical protein
MTIPQRVKVGGNTYEVLFPYTFLERNDLWGQCDHDLNVIRIAKTDGSNDRCAQAMHVAFIHELLHAIERVFCGDKRSDESQIEGLAQGIYSVLKDNGWLK